MHMQATTMAVDLVSPESEVKVISAAYSNIV